MNNEGGVKSKLLDYLSCDNTLKYIKLIKLCTVCILHSPFPVHEKKYSKSRFVLKSFDLGCKYNIV